MRNYASLAVVALALAVAFIQPGCKKDSAGPGAKLSKVNGAVKVNGQAAKAGLPLKAGDKITVEKDGLARVQFADGSRILVFHDPSRNKNGVFTMGAQKTVGGVQSMLVKLSSGICTFLVPPKRKAPLRFEIEATSSITAIHGTEGKVVVQDGGDLIALRSGKVEVSPKAGGAPIPLKAGQQVLIGADGKPQGPLPFNFLAPSEGRFFKIGLPDVKTF